MASRDDPGPARKLHPELTPEQRQRLILEGLELFNAGRYYDCHEAWETVWRSTTPEPRDLWRGLIQVAVAFYHLRVRKRPDVALRVLRKGRRRVEPFAPSAAGLEVDQLLESLDPWEAFLMDAGDQEPPAPLLHCVEEHA